MPVQPNSGAISMVLPSAEWILTRPWEVTFCCCSCMWIMQRENAVLITVLYNECRGSVDYIDISYTYTVHSRTYHAECADPPGIYI